MQRRRADRRRRLRPRDWVAGILCGTGLVAGLLACGDEVLQGDVYEPENTLPIDPPSERPEGGADAGTDASAADVIVVPTTDASNAPTNTCETAREIGTVSGDVSGPSVSTQGTCSEWVSLRATENDDGVFAASMKLKVTLTPPAGEDLDLFAFLNPDKDVVSCTTAFAAAETRTAGASESLSLTWGEGSVANGKDDGRTVGLLVFHPGPNCAGTGKWTLAIDGNL